MRYWRKSSWVVCRVDVEGFDVSRQPFERLLPSSGGRRCACGYWCRMATSHSRTGTIARLLATRNTVDEANECVNGVNGERWVPAQVRLGLWPELLKVGVVRTCTHVKRRKLSGIHSQLTPPCRWLQVTEASS